VDSFAPLSFSLIWLSSEAGYFSIAVVITNDIDRFWEKL
jgi:hypothetical protein